SRDAAAAEPTPLPVPADGYGMEKNSGAIAISSTDFSTPMVRKRTITRPRGVPAVPVAATPPPKPPLVDEADVPTPPPPTNGAPAVSLTVNEPEAHVVSIEDALADSAEARAVEPEPTLHDQASRLRQAELLHNAAAAAGEIGRAHV